MKTPRSPRAPINWITSLFLAVTALLTLVGVPWYAYAIGVDGFSLILFGVGFLVAGLSITVGYHRLFAHRAFQARWPVRLATLIGGAFAFENSALDWAADHRRHHKFVDQDDDPYDITKGFFWAHIGWLLFKRQPEPDHANVKDLLKDPLVRWQHRWVQWIAVAGLLLPALLGFLWNGPAGALGGFLLGGVARVFAVQHCTFFINSLCHWIGRQPYSSRNTARDSTLMAFFTFGEGYHNFHHHFQHDYRNGVKWWQFDPSKWTIWLLAKMGLARDPRRVPDAKILLAELAQTRRQAEPRLRALEAAAAAGAPAPLSARARAWRELTDRLNEGIQWLEEAVAARKEVSRQLLRQWQRESRRLLKYVLRLSRREARRLPG